MKKETLIRKINQKIKYWKKDRERYAQPSTKRTNIGWLISELKEIKSWIKELE